MRYKAESVQSEYVEKPAIAKLNVTDLQSVFGLLIILCIFSTVLGFLPEMMVFYCCGGKKRREEKRRREKEEGAVVLNYQEINRQRMLQERGILHDEGDLMAPMAEPI